MRKRLIVLLWLGLYVLCLWLAVRAAAEAQQISPGASLRYVQALRSDQVMTARAYAQSEQNEGGIFATFWTENESSVQAAASQRTIQEVCSIGFYGAASAAYAANYLYGTAPGDGDTSQCSVSISLAWDLWGSTDVLGQILTLDPDTENARSYEVCGIFSGNSDRVLYGAGSSDAFRYIELTHISLGNPSQSVQKFIAGSGLEQPDQLLCDAAVAWLLDALTGMPVILLLVGCLWNVLFRIFWNKKQRELMMFIVALLFVCLLPMWLSALPGWLIPNQWGSMAAWSSLVSAAGERLQEWFALWPTARDVHLKVNVLQVIAATLGSIVFAIIAFLAWARPITHAPRNADAVPLRGRYAPHRQ